MGNFWGKIGEKIIDACLWHLENHPGRFIGFLIGFLLALAFIVLGFWQTVLLAVLSYVGYFLGKCWDEGVLPSWINRVVHRISFRGKNKS